MGRWAAEHFAAHTICRGAWAWSVCATDSPRDTSVYACHWTLPASHCPKLLFVLYVVHMAFPCPDSLALQAPLTLSHTPTGGPELALCNCWFQNNTKRSGIRTQSWISIIETQNEQESAFGTMIRAAPLWSNPCMRPLTCPAPRMHMHPTAAHAGQPSAVLCSPNRSVGCGPTGAGEQAYC